MPGKAIKLSSSTSPKTLSPRFDLAPVYSEAEILVTNANYHLTLVRMPSLKVYKTSAGEGVEKREPLCTVDGNVNFCNHYGNSREIPQKIKNGAAI